MQSPIPPASFDPTRLEPTLSDWDPATYTQFAPSRAELPPRLRNAHAAPRCAHIKLDGSRCGQPALQNKPLCRFHVRALRTASATSALPIFEDAFSLQLALVRVVRGLESGTLPTKTAALMLYALQIGTMNLKRLEAAAAQAASLYDEDREQSLAEELLTRLDDQEFMRQLTAAAGEDAAAAAPPPFVKDPNVGSSQPK